MLYFLVASCPAPLNITNRRLVNITGGMTDGLYFIGSVAHFQCEAGYRSSDGPSICQANGTWSPMYKCIGKDNVLFPI